MPQTPKSRTPAQGRAGYKWLVLGITGIGTFISALDGSVINIVIPLIQQRFGASIGGVSWVSAVYLLVISSLLLSFGRLGDMWGFKSLYTSGFYLFAAGSVFCGLAPTLGWLIVARAVQGVGAAVLMALGPALIGVTFPGSERGRALGLQATLTYVGLTIGPSLGGWIADHWGWHWVFYINVPITAAGGLLALTLLRRTERHAGQRFDLPGAALFASGLACMLLALTLADTRGWRSPVTLGCLGAGAFLLALFIRQEERAEQPMMPLWLFRSFAFASGVATAFLQYAVIFATFFLLPFYLSGARGLSEQHIGLVMTAQPAVMVAFTGLAGWLSDRIGSKLPATAGLFCLGLGLWLVASGVAVGLPALMLRLCVVGLGSGLFTAPNNSAILGAAPPDRQGIASGLLAAARNVGMATGVAGSGSLFALLRDGNLQRGVGKVAALTGAFRTTIGIAAALAVLGALLSLVRPGKRRA